MEAENPVIRMKALKNETEIANIRKAHLKDGIACTKFMYWLKTKIGTETITEIQASEKLEEFRAEQEHFIGPSFAPICAYKEHAAIVHYSASSKTDAELKKEGMILCDTGGHYMEGSTDITRTIVLGNVTEEEKKAFYNGTVQYAESGGCEISLWVYRDESGLCGKRTVLEAASELQSRNRSRSWLSWKYS